MTEQKISNLNENIIKKMNKILHIILKDMNNIELLENDVRNILPNLLKEDNNFLKSRKEDYIINCIMIILKEKYSLKLNFAEIYRITGYKIRNYESIMKETIEPFFEFNKIIKDNTNIETFKKHFKDNDTILSKIRSNSQLLNDYQNKTLKPISIYKCIELIDKLKYEDFKEHQIQFKYYFTENDFQLLINSIKYMLENIQDKEIFNRFSPRTIVASMSYLVYSDMSQNTIFKIFQTSEVSLRTFKKSKEIQSIFSNFLKDNESEKQIDLEISTKISEDYTKILPICLSNKYNLSKNEIIQVLKRLNKTVENSKYFTYHKFM